jgi:hypothetical protein
MNLFSNPLFINQRNVLNMLGTTGETRMKIAVKTNSNGNEADKPFHITNTHIELLVLRTFGHFA